MVQETGETRDAILEKNQKKIDAILNANKDRKDPYWIMIFATPAKMKVKGLPTLIEHIKPYAVRPPSHVGAIIAEVNNATGKVQWEVNMPQKPFDFDALPGLRAQNANEVVTETTTIPGAYLTK